jgi:hypothetical protein
MTSTTTPSQIFQEPNPTGWNDAFYEMYIDNIKVYEMDIDNIKESQE